MVVEQVKKKIESLSSDSIFEEIHLSEYNLAFCTGCSNCFRKGHEFCPHNKTVQDIIDKITWADGVIFATTTFNMQPTALTKNLIDHLCFMLHRPFFFTKKALIISTTAGIGASNAVTYLAGTLRGLGFNKCYEFPVTSHSWNAFVMNEKTKKKCTAIARKFHSDVSSKKLHSPTWLILIPYNLFRGMSLSYTKGSEYEYIDGKHWTEPVRMNKVYDEAVPVPFYKKPFGSLFYLIGKISPRFIVITYRK